MNDFKYTIIGAGVVGLSIAYQLAKQNKGSVLVIEKESNYGLITSSRNSEVIHSGVYYPKNSLKSKLSIQGKKMLYNFCKEHNIWFNQCGKIIVAKASRLDELKKLKHNASLVGLKNVRILNEIEINKLEPYIKTEVGLIVKDTGVFSSHKFMDTLFKISYEHDHDYLFNYKAKNCQKLKNGYRVFISDKNSNKEDFSTDWVINCAGLYSDIFGKSIKDSINLPEISFSKGNYFQLSNKWRNKFNHLIYPLPNDKDGSLGIHITFDQTGRVRLGPDTNILKDRNEDYSVDNTNKSKFYNEASNYIKGLDIEDISPDYSGIRPKLLNDNFEFSDFYIVHEVENKMNCWINLIGIESPGLTSSLSIAKMVNDIISDWE